MANEAVVPCLLRVEGKKIVTRKPGKIDGENRLFLIRASAYERKYPNKLSLEHPVVDGARIDLENWDKAFKAFPLVSRMMDDRFVTRSYRLIIWTITMIFLNFEGK